MQGGGRRAHRDVWRAIVRLGEQCSNVRVQADGRLALKPRHLLLHALAPLPRHVVSRLPEARPLQLLQPRKLGLCFEALQVLAHEGHGAERMSRTLGSLRPTSAVGGRESWLAGVTAQRAPRQHDTGQRPILWAAAAHTLNSGATARLAWNVVSPAEPALPLGCAS